MNPGVSAAQIVKALIDLHPEIEQLRLFEPQPVEESQARIQVTDPGALWIIEEGRKTRNSLGLPFWDSVLLACYGRGASAATVLQQAMFHNSPACMEFTLTRQDWMDGDVQNLLKNSAQRHRMLVLRSCVKLSSEGHAHIPMVDFRCPATEQNRELAIRASRLLDRAGGYLLESGHSYHFYGKSLLQSGDFPSFLGKVLLLSPVIDRAWIAHQLIEGACGLRISPTSSLAEPLLSAEI